MLCYFYIDLKIKDRSTESACLSFPSANPDRRSDSRDSRDSRGPDIPGGYGYGHGHGYGYGYGRADSDRDSQDRRDSADGGADSGDTFRHLCEDDSPGLINWKCWVNIPNEIAIFHRDNHH